MYRNYEEKICTSTLAPSAGSIAKKHPNDSETRYTKKTSKSFRRIITIKNTSIPEFRSSA